MRSSTIITALVLTAASYLGAENSVPQKSSAHAVHIVSPAANQNVEGSAVLVRFETAAPVQRSHPAIFRVQLDAQPPVETSDSSYTFDGVAPGQHHLIVAAENSRHRVIASSQAKTEFTTSEPAPSVSQLPYSTMLPDSLQRVAMYIPTAAAPADSGDGSGEMPLLSVIGLGVLIGGMVSAMKTRT